MASARFVAYSEISPNKRVQSTNPRDARGLPLTRRVEAVEKPLSEKNGYDKYKRTLGDVLLPDGMNLNRELVKQGWCWWYRKYAPGDTVLEGLETEARTQHREVWAAESPMPPWEWRAQRRDAAKGSPHAQYEHPDPYAETHQCVVHTVSMVPL